MTSILSKKRGWLNLVLASALIPCAAFGQTGSGDDWVAIATPQDQTFNNLNIPADAAEKGMWSPSYDWPMNGLHSVVLADGRVLTFGTSLDGGAQNGRWYDVWDPALGFGLESHITDYDPSRQDSFCAAVIALPNGDMMVSGGNGSDTSNIYNPVTHSTYTATERMAEARWYPTLLTMADGRPIILGGMVPYTEQMQDEPTQAIANGWPSMTPEVLENGEWRSLFGAYSRIAFGPDYLRTSYPRAWVAPDGRIFGISTDQMWYLDANANNNLGEVVSAGTFKGAPSFDAPLNVGPTNTAVMYAPGKILQVGGNGGFNGEELPASNMATVVDITGGTPVLTEQPAMSFARRYPNAIVLANGEVVVTGGATYGNWYSGQPASPVYAAEIWNPNTGTWQQGSTAAHYRGYHSITSLLPNGAILSTGGGTPGPVTNLNAEIYYPPYLFEQAGSSSVLAARPTMVAISGLTYDHLAPMQIDMSNESPIAQLVLIGLSSGTHSFNAGQRRIPLTFTQEQFRLSTTIPSSNLTPPGYYQVVAIGQNGAPSYGTIIAIGQNQAQPPIVTVPYEPPVLSEGINTPELNPGEAVTYAIPEVVGTTYRWDISDGTSTSYSTSAELTHSFAQPGAYVVTLTALRDNIETSYSFVQAVSTSTAASASASASQMVIDQASNRLWVVNPDNNTVTVLDASSNQKLAETPVGISPRNIAVGAGNEIWVTNKHSASLSVIDRNSFSVTQTINLPRASQPHGLVFNPAKDTAFVTLEAKGQLVAINSSNKQIINSVDLGQNIRGVAYDSLNNQLLVSRFITQPLSGESTAQVNTQSGGGEVLFVNATNLTLTNTALLQYSNKADTTITGSGLPNYLAAPAISPSGAMAWVPSKQDNITRGMLRSGQPLDFQNSVRAISSAVQINTASENYALRIDHDNSGLGSAATFHPNGVYLFVALETSREVAVVNSINGSELFRIQVGFAPQALAVSADGLTLFVKNFMDRTVSVVDLTALITTGQLISATTATISTVQNESLAQDVLQGKKFFYDAKDTRLALDAYLSCASCHNDGGQDGRVWDFTGFGEGLRNTIKLKGRGNMLHGLLHWSGNFDEVQDFEVQIRNFAGGTGLMSDADYFRTSVEAEDYENLTQVSPFEQTSVNGRTVMYWPGTGQINNEILDSTDGQLHYTVNATSTSLTLFAIVDMPTGSDDSFYFKLEGADPTWYTFNNQGTVGFEEREIYTWSGLSVGQTYTLKIMRREDGTLLDSFYVIGGEFGSSEDKTGLSADLDSLASYLGSLQGTSADKGFAPSPFRNEDGSNTALAQAGATVFSQNCSSCHGGNNFTNSSGESDFANVGTLNTASGQRSGGPLSALDVPTLRDVWSSAPYLHNGSADTISAAISAHNNVSLNSQQLSEVVAFVEQIGNQTEVQTNSAPVIIGTLNNFNLELNQSAVQIDLLTLFSDPDGDPLNFTHQGSAANVQLSGNVLTINPLQVGSDVHTILAADGISGSAQLQFSVTVNDDTQTFAVVLQAEDQTWLAGTVDSNHAGYNGVGFLNTENVLGTWFELTVQIPSAGTYDFAVRYANGSSNRNQEVYVNGGLALANLDLPPTGAWATWQEQTFSLDLNAGAQTIRFVSLTSAGAPNVDQISITGSEPAINTPPVVSGAIANQNLAAGQATVTFNLNSVFSDADGDALSYSVSASSNVFVSGSTLSITPNNAGTETITVTANDNRGGQVSTSFQLVVNAANNPPQVSSPIADINVNMGSPTLFYDLNQAFFDTDGDSLTYSVTPSSNVSLSGSTLTVATSTPTSVAINVSANDGNGGTASFSFNLTVIDPNTAPVVVNPIGNLNLVLGDSPQNFDLNQVFADANGDSLIFSVSSSSNVQLSGATLTVSANVESNTNITVSANDGNGGTVSTSFNLTVVAPNTAPVVQNPIGNQSLVIGDSPIVFNLNQVFSDADGDNLSFSVSSSSNVQLSGSTLTLFANAQADGTITVSANDGNGGTVSTSFNLLVEAPAEFNLTVEAEAQTWQEATIDSNHAGFTGSGFVNTSNFAGVWFELGVDVPVTGTYNITVRYANGSSARAQQILVNGQNAIASVDFPGTGAWATWANVTFSVNLTAGANQVRFVSLTSGGAANIDNITIELAP